MGRSRKQQRTEGNSGLLGRAYHYLQRGQFWVQSKANKCAIRLGWESRLVRWCRVHHRALQRFLVWCTLAFMLIFIATLFNETFGPQTIASTALSERGYPTASCAHLPWSGSCQELPPEDCDKQWCRTDDALKVTSVRRWLGGVTMIEMMRNRTNPPDRVMTTLECAHLCNVNAHYRRSFVPGILATLFIFSFVLFAACCILAVSDINAFLVAEAERTQKNGKKSVVTTITTNSRAKSQPVDTEGLSWCAKLCSWCARQHAD